MKPTCSAKECPNPMSVLPAEETSSGARYNLTAIAFHWATALLIIGMLLSGFYMVGIPKGTPGRALYFNLHKSFGVLTGVLILLRLWWRVTHVAPALPAG